MIHLVGINPINLNWRHFILAVTPQDEMAGCGQIKIHADHSRELASLAVFPMYQRMGIGSLVIRHFLANQPPPLYLTCRSRLRPFYEKYGFKVCAEDHLPPYFQRLWRFSRFARRFFPRLGELTIMHWE